MEWNQPCQHSFQLTCLLLLPSLSFCSPHSPHYGKRGQRWLTALSLRDLSSLSFFMQTLHRQGLIRPFLLGACPWKNQVCQDHSPTASMWKYPSYAHIGEKKPLLENGTHSPSQGLPTPSNLETPQSRSDVSVFPKQTAFFFLSCCFLSRNLLAPQFVANKYTYKHIIIWLLEFLAKPVIFSLPIKKMVS